MTRNVLVLLGGLSVLSWPMAAPAQVVVYDNMSGLSETWQSSMAVQDRGNEVILASPGNRYVTMIEFAVTRQGVPGSLDAIVKIWANDGAGGKPGTLLWTSPPQTDVFGTEFSHVMSFPVPGVPVPSHLTFTICEYHAVPWLSYGEVLSDRTSVGTSVAGWMKSDSGGTDWTRLGWDTPAGMRISATPEPGSLSLMALAALVTLRRRRRR